MTPLYIGDCFAMLHPAAGRHGVLICSTLGDEALNVYRPLVHLADRFAALGCPALRFEYYGTGDSGGEDGEPGRFQSWLSNITVGVAWLREHCGVGPVTLVGVRLGAMLAARAACGIDDVDSLILLAPAASGRRFLREMVLRANATAEIWQVANHIEDGGWFEAHGMRLDRCARNELDRLDLAALPRRPAAHALVLDRHDSPAGSFVAERLRRLGTDVTSDTAHGLAEMLRDPYENAVPHEAFARAVDYTLSRARQSNDAANSSPTEACEQAPIALPARRIASPPGPARGSEGAAELCTSTGRESPVWFGPSETLFGILCTPAHPRDNAPPVLIANTGANPRSGNSRSAVTIARWLAANGIASLRMDGSGAGDSGIKTGERGKPYSAQADDDLTAGVDELSRRFNTPVLVLGMCSGAFHALRAAYNDHRISGLMLLNLQKLAWQEGESLSVVQHTTFRTTRFYLRHVGKAQVWQRVLRGEVNIGGIVRALAGRAARRISAAADPLLAPLRRQETQVGSVRRKVRELRQRRVPILFVLSGNDPGLDEIAEYFGAQGRQFRRQPNVMFRILDGADHTLSAHWAREALLGYVADFLRQRCRLAVDATEQTAAPVRAGSTSLDAAFVSPVAIDTPGTAA